MVRVMKSPNMMSTTGRRPVMAAPTATPVNPASEIGVSTTRFAPNSSTKPERTLKGVPASATSSPMMQTRESRRISSASASRTACANVSSRSGIDVLLHLIQVGIGRCNRELHRRLHDRANFGRNSIKGRSVRMPLVDQPLRQHENGITLNLPELFFLFRAVVFAIDIADMMSAVTVGIALQERRSASSAGAANKAGCNFVDSAYILTVNARGLNTESGGTAKNGTSRRFGIVRVFVVQIILTNVDDRQLPQLRQVHHFVERSLAERAFSEEADRDAIRAEILSGKSRARSDANTAADNCVRPEISSRRIGDVHRPAFASTIPRFFAQQLGEHSIW